MGVLCRLLGRIPFLGYRLLGSAGVDGFLAPTTGTPAGRGKFIWDNRWLTGDHGAALEPSRMESVAAYLIEGQRGSEAINASMPSSMGGVRLILWAIVLLIVATVAAIGLGLFAVGGRAGSLWDSCRPS